MRKYKGRALHTVETMKQLRIPIFLMILGEYKQKIRAAANSAERMTEVANSEKSSLVSMKNGIMTELIPIDTQSKKVAKVLATKLTVRASAEKLFLLILGVFS